MNVGASSTIGIPGTVATAAKFTISVTPDRQFSQTVDGPLFSPARAVTLIVASGDDGGYAVPKARASRSGWMPMSAADPPIKARPPASTNAFW